MIKKEGVAVLDRESTAPTTTVPTSTAPTLVLPERKYFKIGEVAELVGVEPHVLRYWETQFSQLRPHKARSGHRLYRRREVETLLVIKDLLHIQRFTIAGARQALRQQGTTSLLPRAAESVAERAVQLSLPPTSARGGHVPGVPSIIEDLDDVDEEDDEVELHLADPVARSGSLGGFTEIEIEAKDGDDLEEALAAEVTAQKAKKGVVRIEVRATSSSKQTSAQAKKLLTEAVRDLELIVLKLKR